MGNNSWDGQKSRQNTEEVGENLQRVRVEREKIARGGKTGLSRLRKGENIPGGVNGAGMNIPGGGQREIIFHDENTWGIYRERLEEENIPGGGKREGYLGELNTGCVFQKVGEIFQGEQTRVLSRS